MEQLAQHLAKDKRDPRLWFERLVVFSNSDTREIVRTVPFRRGMNIVWAKEPAAGGAVGVHAAGHGVGKTSLCLLLRFCLGDPSKAVSELRDELHGEFPKGGVFALLHLDGQVLTLCRYFNPHRDGIAHPGDRTDDPWGRDHDEAGSDRDFLGKLEAAMMSHVSPDAIPDTGQEIEWRHVLAWLSRDQGSRFKSFFAWREGEGTGLRRGRQDPPIVMRAALGLMDPSESVLLSRISKLELELEEARQKEGEIQREPALIRRRIESNLRAMGALPEELPIRAGDLFSDSVERRIKIASNEAEDRLAECYREQEQADQALADLRAELKTCRIERDRACAEYDFAEAGRRGDEAAYKSIGADLLRLRNLAGYCGEGNVSFSQCEYVKSEINRLSMGSFQNQRDKQNLQKAMRDSAGRSVMTLARKKATESKVKDRERQEEQFLAAQHRARMSVRTAEIEAAKWPGLLEELARWEGSHGSSAAEAEVSAAQTEISRIEGDLTSARTRLALLHQQRSSRQETLAAMTNALTHRVLPNGAFGAFHPRDDDRPFRLSMRGGEAYRVLEVLLGDVVCLLDSANAASALPGLLIHDCPREADMSAGLYEHFLLLVDALEFEVSTDSWPPFQYIVTTTTPPPRDLREGAVCLTLEPDSEDGLLFRRRFGGGQSEMVVE